MVAKPESVATAPSTSRARPSNTAALPFPFPSGHKLAAGGSGAGPISLLADVALRYTAPRKLATISARPRDPTQQLPSISNLTGHARARSAHSRPSPSASHNDDVSGHGAVGGIDPMDGRGWKGAQTRNADADANPTESSAQSHQSGFMRSNSFLQHPGAGSTRDPSKSVSRRADQGASPAFGAFWGEMPGAEWYAQEAYYYEHESREYQRLQALPRQHGHHAHMHYHHNQASAPRDAHRDPGPGGGSVELLRPNQSVHSAGLPSPAYSTHDDERHVPSASGGQGWNQPNVARPQKRGATREGVHAPTPRPGSATAMSFTDRRQPAPASRYSAIDGPRWGELPDEGGGRLRDLQKGRGTEDWRQVATDSPARKSPVVPPPAPTPRLSPRVEHSQRPEAATTAEDATQPAGEAPGLEESHTPSTLHDDHNGDEDDFDGETSSDSEDEYRPAAKRTRTRTRTQAPARRSGASTRTRASARLRIKREHPSDDEHELQEVAPGEVASASASGSASMAASASASPMLQDVETPETGQDVQDAEGQERDDEYAPKPKKRAYVRRDAQRRKEQNAQAQKKFRWKKKVMAEQMRSDLDEQRRIVDELRERCATLEGMLADRGAMLAEAQAENGRLKRRLQACACEC